MRAALLMRCRMPPRMLLRLRVLAAEMLVSLT
jgi:hypothetical protein